MEILYLKKVKSEFKSLLCGLNNIWETKEEKIIILEELELKKQGYRSYPNKHSKRKGYKNIGELWDNSKHYFIYT